ncbi:MAG: OmpW family protein [Novosphingobium sp.]|nr:OmpW family protein [Novosphingobium sp.]
MRKMTMLAATALVASAAATALAAPAMAGSPDGKWQVKVLGSAVLPDGKIDKIKSIDAGTTLGGTLATLDAVGTKANDNVVPTLAVEYFFTKTFSVETICCFTQHHVSGTGDIAGAGLVDHVLILPATATAKAHLDTGTPFKPYVGAGPAWFFVFDEKPGETARALGVDRVKMSNKLGFALQAGMDIAINDKGLGLSLDAKKYWVKPTASFYAGDDLALKTRHDLDPWVLSAGVSYRF